MKNHILLFSTTLVFLFFGCQNASDKIKDDTTIKIPKNTPEKPPSNSSEDNTINAQIIDDEGRAKFEFINEGETVWDFGTIQEGDSPEFTFRFKNTGTEPMIISNAKGSCGCTVPAWPKEPIAPGDEGEINVKFNSKGKKGSQNKTVTLTANTQPTSTKLRVTGQIESAE